MRSPSPGNGATLLAVDDRQDNLFVLEQLIADGLPGCSVITATSAKEGLAIAASTHIDGALIDVQMPTMSGIEMCRRLKADGATADIHVILVTAHEATTDLKTEGLNAGADDFISKPINNAELLARIKAMLRLRRAEDELRELNERLEDVVTERTRTLRDQLRKSALAEQALQESEKEKEQLEEQFRQSQKMEAVGRLAGGVAHDFNNLLTVINSYAGFASDELRDGDPMKADIEMILTAGQRAADLTRQLLIFSRKQVMEPRVLDLNEVVSELQKMLRRLIGEDIDLCTSLGDDLGRITADPGQLEQVLMNLTVNARDAMPKGGTLTIETANVELDEESRSMHADSVAGPHVMLTVSDNGPGMTAEVKAQIFEPFFTTKEAGTGTGLGLATVYGIVKQSGGSIWVDSEPGQGTTFKIYLPRVEAEKTEERRHTDITELRGSEMVLLVEDEEAVRTLTRRMLVSAGYQVITASNGGEALLECERYGGVIHLLLTDVVMPKMSGKDLVNRLAKLRPSLKALFMSGYTGDVTLHHGVTDEGVLFIAKPFNAQALLRKVRTVLDGAD